MNEFKNLDTYLSQPFHPDYWSDEALPYATFLINLLNQESWNLLREKWSNKPVDWQVRLAETLYGSEREEAISLLISMLAATDQLVAVAASESLASKDYKWRPDASLRKVLQRLSTQLEGYEQQTIISLLERIP